MRKYHLPLEAAQALIVLNGERCDCSAVLERACDYATVFVADGAWNDLHETLSADNVGVELVVMGDGDSINHKPAQFIETANQDFTDCEKIVAHCVERGIACADVYWASGAEMDHFLGNLSVAAKYHQRIELRFFDATHLYFFAEQHSVIEGAAGKGISIYPFPECLVTSRGLAYEMDRLQLTLHHQQSLRNRVQAARAEIFIDGSAFVFLER